MRDIFLAHIGDKFRVISDERAYYNSMGSAFEAITELQNDFEDINLVVERGAYCIKEKLTIPSNIHINAKGADVFNGTIFYGEGVNANIVLYSGSSLSGVVLSGFINITIAGNNVNLENILDKRNGGHTIFPTDGRADFTILEINEIEGFLRVEGKNDCYHSAGIDLEADGTLSIGSLGGDGVAFSPSQTKAILDRLNAYYKEHVKEEAKICLTTENSQTMS